MMDLTYVIHIAAGSIGLITGYTAIAVAKGGRLHRRAGMIFVYVMLVMCAAGFTIAVTRSVAPSVNVPAALLTGYLVATSLATVRAVPGARWLQVGGMLVASGVGLTCAVFAYQAVQGRPPDGMPAFPFFMFGTVGLLGAVGDVRVLLRGPLRGVSRLARHLWRMSFALFIAALSFFIGQADVFPRAIRIMPLLGLPVLAVLLTMLYWLWRVRFRHSLRGLSLLKTADAAESGALKQASLFPQESV